MRTFIFLAIAIHVSTTACHQKKGPLVDHGLIDSVLSQKGNDAFEKSMKEELTFWEARAAVAPGAFTAWSRYAGCLIQQFHSKGRMKDLLLADSILMDLNLRFKENEASILRTLASVQITRHRFPQADSFANKALTIGTEKFATLSLLFDTRFETGNYRWADQALKQCVSTNDFGYLFRKAKWEHFKGETDSALHYFTEAAKWSGNSMYLKQTAFSNMADLYMHEGDMEQAAELYMTNLLANISDHHSLKGLGRIVLMHDHEPELAATIFKHIADHNALPDPYYDLVWVAEEKEDSLQQLMQAKTFVQKAADPLYGGMYHKYLIDLYTGILGNPAEALRIAELEMANRSTPQTNAWLAWALHKAGKKEEALSVYKQKVSGQPLEAQELYWMGKMMEDEGKRYQAEAYFKAASKNRYDLSPKKQKDLEHQLN